MTKLTSQELLDFSKDVAQIAKFMLWHTEQGDKLAEELILEIHAGKYGSHEGIWPQFDRALSQIEGALDVCDQRSP